MIQPQSVRDKKCAMSGSGFNIAMIRSEQRAESGIVGDLYVYGQPARRLSSFDQNHEPCVSRAAWPAHLSLLFAESDSGSEPLSLSSAAYSESKFQRAKSRFQVIRVILASV